MGVCVHDAQLLHDCCPVFSLLPKGNVLPSAVGLNASDTASAALELAHQIFNGR